MIKVGRNDPCPCGSGKKYKKCCYLDDEKNARILKVSSKVNSREDMERILSKPPRIYMFKVTLETMMLDKIEPEVSRIIEIAEDRSLYDFHLSIQEAFEWDNDHMFSFFMNNRIGDDRYEYKANPLGEWEPSGFIDDSKSAAEVDIGDLNLKKQKKFTYVFDYGDRLVHTIRVIDTREKTEQDTKPWTIIEKIGNSLPQYPDDEST